MRIALVVVLAVVVAAGGLLVVMSGHTAIQVSPAVTSIGISTPVTVRLANPHGVREVRALVEQGGAQYPVFESRNAATRLLWHRHEAPLAVIFNAGKSQAPNLKDGPARLVVEAVSNDFAGHTDSAAFDVTVVLEPPRVAADGERHYINQGGAELVVLTPGGSWNEAGVRVGGYTFRSFPMPDHSAQRFSMIAYPWDLAGDVVPVVYARNAAGAEATAPVTVTIKAKKFRARDFDLTDALMDKLVHSVDSSGALAPGKDLLARFLFINGPMRRRNNQQLADLRLKTEEKILWAGAFLHWGKEEANFADLRNYIYHGQKVDQQVHLGFDLSDVAHGPVFAANNGRVVWAQDLGIYGNCIVLDHGYSVQSVYGHLSEIGVKVGDWVDKGQRIGVAGETGLAGGIHVHFGMQVDGVQVNPREWWDEHWIHDHVLIRLQPEAAHTEKAAPGPAPAKPHHHKKKR
ncbi:MAG TPA: M23 family metallopeptidase [Bryobacteraceae bacterium]